jgi:hypothetical protein
MSLIAQAEHLLPATSSASPTRRGSGQPYNLLRP